VWQLQDEAFFEEAIIEADGTMVETGGQCKEGIDINYKGQWGYHPLMVSLDNTGEPLFVVNRSGSRPSHEGAAAYLDKSVALCRRAGFRRIETAAGEEAQVDFGTGAPVRQEDGRKKRTYVFRLVLSHSRKAYSEAVYRQTTENFIRAIENAFWYFGGTTQTLVIDKACEIAVSYGAFRLKNVRRLIENQAAAKEHATK